MTDAEKFWLHKEYPKTCAADDFWGQIKRTVNGKPVAQEQIDLIINAVLSGLNLTQADILLDLGCGNGALSRYFFPHLSGMLGVDFSAYLIEIAKQYFERKPFFIFFEGDIVSFVNKEASPDIFTKALCYGTFAYLSLQNARILLETMHRRFINVELFFIGNLPDKEKIDAFYKPGVDYAALINDNASPIGVWRSQDEMQRLAAETGWIAEIRRMPASFYAAHYRYDVLLRRNL
jgi:cyclopropane fatty-acyl-phospholipid synthase-like methyltransferase